MKTDLKDYIQVFENMIPDDVCNTSVKELDSANWEQHLFYNKKENNKKSLSGNKELNVSYDSISTRQILMDCIYQTLINYLNNLSFPWFSSWSGYAGIRFNRYQETQLMAKHCDHIFTLFEGNPRGIPILSVVGSINDDYEGGEFIMFDDYHVELPKGAIMVFPSNFLYPHKVEPVTKGTRHTFVSWVY